MNYSKAMLEKKNDLITRAEEVLNKAKLETRELTTDEAEELAEIRDNVRKIVASLKLDDDFMEMDDHRECKKEVREGESEMTEEEKKVDIEAQETRAFEDYIRGNVMNERGTDVNLTKAGNGAVIPSTIANRIIKTVYDVCPVLEKSEHYNVKGTLNLPYYTVDGTNTGIQVAYQDEFATPDSTNGKFASISLTGFLAGALSKVSKSLINNAQFNIVDFVVRQMGEDIARFIEGELLNGTVDKVDGLSKLANKLTSGAEGTITTNELISLQAKVKQRYQGNALWIMNPDTFTAIRQLKDSQGRYILNPDLTKEFGFSLLGKPVYISDNMPAYTTAGATAIYYGDMKGLAVKFGEEINVEVLREAYANQHAVGITGWFEFDAKVQDAQKIAKLVMANES